MHPEKQLCPIVFRETGKSIVSRLLQLLNTELSKVSNFKAEEQSTSFKEEQEEKAPY